MADTIQGTSIEDIELGKVENVADEDKIDAILADMNVEHAPPQYMQQQMPPQYQQMPPRMAMQQRQPMPPSFQDMYEEPEEAEPEPPKYKVAKKVKRNRWSISLDGVMDPIVVGILVILLSLPVLHTWAGKHVGWAYKLGGELSWPGLLVIGVLGALLFGLYRSADEYLNRN
jgi:hypothetical protein